MKRFLLFILLLTSLAKADYYGSHAIDDYLTVQETLHDSSGDGVAATGPVDLWVYKDDDPTHIIDLTMDAFDSVTGLYEQKFQLTAVAGFEAGKTYTILIQATADGVSGILTHMFQITASVNVASEDNIDFGAQKKTSLNAATTDLSAITGDKDSYKATGFAVSGEPLTAQEVEDEVIDALQNALGVVKGTCDSGCTDTVLKLKAVDSAYQNVSAVGAFQNYDLFVLTLQSVARCRRIIVATYAAGVWTLTLDAALPLALSENDIVWMRPHGGFSDLELADLESEAGDALGTLEGRLTAARAGYLDNLNGHTAQTGDSYALVNNGTYGLSALEALVDDLESRLTALRAGYLDALNGHTAQTGDTYALANNGTYGLAAMEALVDDLETRLTAARAGYLDELAAANLPTDIADVPTVSEFNARTLAAANYFIFGTDPVELLDSGGTAGTSAAELIDDFFAEVLEGTIDFGDFMRILGSYVAGDLGIVGNVYTYTGLDGVTTRIEGTSTASGRTVGTVDGD